MAIGPNIREIANAGMVGTFAAKSGDVFAKYQEVAFGADNDTITSVTTATTVIGVILDAVPAGKADGIRRYSVRLNGHSVVPMIGNGTCTMGFRAVATGVAGKVTDAGATPDARTVQGIFLATSAVDGDLVPVLI